MGRAARGAASSTRPFKRGVAVAAFLLPLRLVIPHSCWRLLSLAAPPPGTTAGGGEAQVRVAGEGAGSKGRGARAENPRYGGAC